MDQLAGRGSPVPGATLAPSGTRLIDSMPQAIPASMASEAISAATRWVACCADPHWASIVVAPVRWGRPACSQARRTMSFDCSPACVTHPPITWSTIAGSRPDRLSTAR